MATITLEQVSYTYSRGTPFEVKALQDVDLCLPDNRITGIIGHTGSGKSTLLQLLNGLIKPEGGRVLLDGQDIWETPKDIGKIRFRVGLVMQYPEYQLFEETVRADIAFGPKNKGLDDAEIARRVAEAADFVGLSPELLDKSPFDLSGGEKRRAAIAGVIAMRPEVLVLDEPAAGLDPAGRTDILEGIGRYQRETGAAVILVSHSMEDMANYCDTIVVMADGKVRLTGDTATVFAQTELLHSVGLDVPQITRVMRCLAEAGVPVDPAVYTVEDALKELTNLR